MSAAAFFERARKDLRWTLGGLALAWCVVLGAQFLPQGLWPLVHLSIALLMLAAWSVLNASMMRLQEGKTGQALAGLAGLLVVSLVFVLLLLPVLMMGEAHAR